MQQLNSIADLIGNSSNEPAFVPAYYPGQLLMTNPGNLGGGVFMRAGNMLKSKHNGGDIISDTVGAWDGTRANLGAFHDGVGETNPSGTGCWVRLKDQSGASGFGATGNYEDDDTIPIGGYFRAANKIGMTMQYAIKGKTRYFPDGGYPVTRPDAITCSGVRIKGESSDGTVFLCSGLGTPICFGNATSGMIVGGGVYNVKFEYPTAPPPGFACCIYAENANRLDFENIMLAGVSCFLFGGNDANTRNCTGVTARNVKGWALNAGQRLFQFNLSAGIVLDDVRVYVPVDVPAANVTSTMGTLPGTTAIYLGNAACDTVQITNCLFERFYDGLKIQTNGPVVQNVTQVDAMYDYCRNCAVVLSAGGTTGGIYNVKSSNCWFSSWENSAFVAGGSGTISDVEIDSCSIGSSGAHGIQIGATNAIGFNIHDNIINGCGRITANCAAIAIYYNQATHMVRGNRGGADATSLGFPWQVDYGFLNSGGNVATMQADNPLMQGRVAPYLV